MPGVALFDDMTSPMVGKCRRIIPSSEQDSLMRKTLDEQSVT